MVKKIVKLFGAEFQSEMLETTFITWQPTQIWAEKAIKVDGSVLLEFVSEEADYLVTIQGSGPYAIYCFDGKGVLQTPPKKFNLSTDPIIRVQSYYVLLKPIEERSIKWMEDIMYLKIEN